MGTCGQLPTGWGRDVGLDPGLLQAGLEGAVSTEALLPFPQPSWESQSFVVERLSVLGVALAGEGQSLL